MKRLTSLFLFAGLLLAGCHHPDEVVLPPDTTSDPQMNITAITLADTASAAGQFDSSGVLPSDLASFGAFLTLNRVVDDFAVAGVRVTRTREFAKAVFTDRSQPVQFGQVTWGYQGIRLASIMIDSLSLREIPHTVPIPTVGNVAAGYEYTLGLGGKYVPGKEYRWSIRQGMGPTDTISIQTPPALIVTSPIGGQTISRTVPLELKWNGSGKITIVISEYYPLAKKARPLFVIVPEVNTGRLVLRPKVLAVLPARQQTFVISFLLYNRNEGGAVSGYPNKVLVLATSVYDTIVDIQ